MVHYKVSNGDKQPTFNDFGLGDMGNNAGVAGFNYFAAWDIR